MVTKEMPPAVQKLHDQSLTQGRDVLSQTDESEKQKWMAKDETDWSGTFGQDLAQYAKRLGAWKSRGADDPGSVGNGEVNKYQRECEHGPR
jgi:hypothetical protein